MTSLGTLFLKYYKTRNPVTRSVYRDIIANRFDAIERQSKIDNIEHTHKTRSTK